MTIVELAVKQSNFVVLFVVGLQPEPKSSVVQVKDTDPALAEVPFTLL